MHLRGWVWPPGHLSGAISFCSALRFSCFIVPFGKQIWMLPRLLYTLSENKQIILCVSLHHLLILFPFFCFPFPAAYHMPTSLIDLALLLVSPCFVTPVWTSLFFFVVSFLYVYRCGARPWSPNPQEEGESFSAFVSVVWSLPHVHALLGCLCLASVKLFSKHHTVPRQNVMNFN